VSIEYDEGWGISGFDSSFGLGASGPKHKGNLRTVQHLQRGDPKGERSRMFASGDGLELLLKQPEYLFLDRSYINLSCEYLFPRPFEFFRPIERFIL
jgi:hypothetical protein